ncbi:MAG: zinc-ribbon domain-containing protein [Planctomycetaceae bacterium]|nr:zinc-ribbon domain-containing protein [Planctomycetaceae bacterium]
MGRRWTPIVGQRKVAHYVGIGLMVIGGLVYFSVFISHANNFGNFTNFESHARSSMFRAIGGMALIIVGGFIRGIGARGLAGSGVLLDPKRARSELEPFSRMAGAMVMDALDEAEIDLGSGKAERVVMVKCRECGKLNEEDSKFCQECGKPI